MKSVMQIEDCPCGRKHICAVRKVEIGEEALQKIPAILDGYRHVLTVSDRNTDRVCGSMVCRILADAGFLVTTCLLQENDHPVVVPDENSIAQIEEKLSEEIEVIVGIGSGVINDLCKYVSFFHHLPYMIVATAPSMDGYASSGAAMILKGMKVTVPARVPEWIVADAGVLADAPVEMIRAGAGDILGKISCLNDWKLSQLITGEYFCAQIYRIVQEQIRKTEENLERFLTRDPQAVAQLMDSLVTVGIAMAYVGNSRPASGSEHHLSHFYEITGITRKEKYLPHGIDVAYGTVITCFLRRRLLQMTPSDFSERFDRETWKREIARVYGTLAGEVEALQDKVGFYQQRVLPEIGRKWDAIKTLFQECPTGQEIMQLIRRIGYRPEEFLTYYSQEKIRDSIIYAKDLKDRYTVLWLMQETGTAQVLAEETVEMLEKMQA